MYQKQYINSWVDMVARGRFGGVQKPRVGGRHIVFDIDFVLLTGITRSYMYGTLSLSPTLGFFGPETVNNFLPTVIIL